MKWFIQDSTNFGSLDRNVTPLIAALKELQVPYQCMGLVPFSWELTGIERDEPKDNVIFYGGTKLIEKIAKDKEYTPGVFYEPEWFDQNNWAANRNDLLNQDFKTITVGELKKNWIEEVSFIRPKEVKTFVGQVIEVEEKDSWAEENSELPDDTELHISPVHNIEREWRFFTVGGEIVCGSLYKRWRMLSIKESIPAEVWEQARRMASMWLPSPNIVMDICQLRDGTFKIVEFNALNCSGGYNIDWKLLIKAIEEYYDL